MIADLDRAQLKCGKRDEAIYVVERTFAWLSQFRRLRVRYDKRADIHQAFLSLVCALICWQSLRKTWIRPELVPKRFP